MQVSDATVLEIPNDRTDTYLNAIRQQIGSHLQLVVTIFPTSRDDRYSALKKLCCVDSPIPSQVINPSKIPLTYINNVIAFSLDWEPK